MAFAISYLARTKTTNQSRTVSGQLSISARKSHELRSNGQTKQRWSNMNQNGYCKAYFSPQTISETYFSVLFSRGGKEIGSTMYRNYFYFYQFEIDF